MEYKKIYSKKEDPFEGYFLVKIPGYVERMKNLKELNLKVREDGGIDINDDTYDSLISMGKLASRSLISLDLLHKKSKRKFVSLEELEPYQEYQEIMQEIANCALQGASLGN